MALSFSAGLRNAIADTILAEIDAGASAATLKIYTAGYALSLIHI